MINPLKDIVIGTSLGLIAGTMWNSFKNSELKRTADFYKFYDAQQAKKAALAEDDE